MSTKNNLVIPSWIKPLVAKWARQDRCLEQSLLGEFFHLALFLKKRIGIAKYKNKIVKKIMTASLC
jgi:hypothetical protein